MKQKSIPRKYLLTAGFIFVYLFSGAQSFKRITNINPSGDALPVDFTIFKGKLFFSATDGTNGYQLWSIDSSVSGATELTNNKKVMQGPGGLFGFANNLFFTPSDGSTKNTVWVTDGTKSGTKACPDSTLMYPIAFTTFNGKLLFSATDTSRYPQLWQIDSNSTIVLQLTHFKYGVALNPEGFVSYKGKLYFSGDDDIHGSQLWETDGSEVGTKAVTKVNSSSFGLVPYNFIVLKDTLYFAGNDGKHGYQLWKSDGTDSGTKEITNINPNGPSGLYVYDMISTNSRLFFTGCDSGNTRRQLWMSDGTDTGTKMIKAASSVSGFYDIYPQFLTEYNGKVYFQGTDPIYDFGLWVSDGTDKGTKMLKNIDKYSYASLFTVFANKLYFKAYDSLHGYQLWVTNGTDTGTRMFTPFPSTSINFEGLNLADQMIVYNNELYFAGSYDTTGAEVWSFSPTLKAEIEENISTSINLSVYPNPAQAVISIRANGLQPGKMGIICRDILGRTVLIRQEIVSDSLYEGSIDISLFKPGMYILEIVNGETREETKLLIR